MPRAGDQTDGRAPSHGGSYGVGDGPDVSPPGVKVLQVPEGRVLQGEVPRDQDLRIIGLEELRAHNNMDDGHSGRFGWCPA